MIIWIISNFNSNPVPTAHNGHQHSLLGQWGAYCHIWIHRRHPQSYGRSLFIPLIQSDQSLNYREAKATIHQVYTFYTINYVTNCQLSRFVTFKTWQICTDHWSLAPSQQPMLSNHILAFLLISTSIIWPSSPEVWQVYTTVSWDSWPSKIPLSCSIAIQKMAGKCSMKANVYLNFDFRIEKRLNIAILLHQELYLTVEPTLVGNFTNKSLCFCISKVWEFTKTWLVSYFNSLNISHLQWQNLNPTNEILAEFPKRTKKMLKNFRKPLVRHLWSGHLPHFHFPKTKKLTVNVAISW